MSKIVMGVMYCAIALIVAATYFNVLFVASGSGAVLVIAIVYSYVVAKREGDGLEGGYGTDTRAHG